ncbi:tetratricopeptide repeat protein [Kribbella sp. VKM Ac-2571]|uniref:tetratricopeptide repeat protein n=1 Tax=Kribbella sp. VKM Ac-2571 TaxID=2512222 RepID=UPI00105E7B06|nr:tetratricopeptide repeat protein [Kribbella sp. VKM Ac-2571]TDO45491.1 tetratricopeptide repeat protein [Kribbella sp. VKM Ac-2571]
MTAAVKGRRDTYVRIGMMTVGDLGVVGGLAGWILGWRFGHLLVTLSLVLLIAGMWPGKFRPRRSVAGGYVLVGRHLKGVEALDSARKAAHHYRKLAVKHPDEGLVLLAGTLDWQRALLRELGRHEDAEPVAREAVETWREVVTIDSSRRENLSKALHHLTGTLAELNREGELTTLTEEAVVVQRSLVATHEVLLALHLQNLATQLRRTDRWEAALPVAQEAATLYRRLVPTDPDLLEHAAHTVEGFATTLRRLERPLESLQSTQEWVEYERTLADRLPDRRPELAEALRILGNRSADLDHIEDGLTRWRESLELWRQLASEGREHNAGYADACTRIGYGLGVVGETTESLAVFRTGLDVRRTLATLDSRQYDDLLDDLARATQTTLAPEFAVEAVAVAREHADALTADTLARASDQLREAGFTAEAEELSAHRR